jgi:predicted Zn-dependent peptidase
MAYYTIKNGSILIADNKESLKYYNDIKILPSDYEEGKYIVENNELVLNPNFEEEKAQKERERIAQLKLTKREVFLGLYQAKGVTPEQIKAQITDPMALIEFEYANDYYRGNPLIDSVGAVLGITAQQLDCFFETNDYTCLLPVEVKDE